MEISSRVRITFLIGILVTLLLGILMWIRFPPGEVLENKLYDYRFKIRGVIKPPEYIVIATIDEKSTGDFCIPCSLPGQVLPALRVLTPEH